MEVIVYILLVAVTSRITDALLCRECVAAPHLEQCTASIQCNGTEICYTESVIHDGFVVKFNAGCSPRSICGHTGSFVGKRQTHLMPCSKCCEGSDLCNANLCGITSNETVVLPTVATVRTSTSRSTLAASSATSASQSSVITSPIASLNTSTVSSVGGLKCRKCVNASHLEDCTEVVQCQSGEHCYTESIVHIASFVVKFNAGCSSRTICGFTSSIVGKRQTHLLPCSRCCEDSDLCNANLCGITSNQTVVLTSIRPVDTTVTAPTSPTSILASSTSSSVDTTSQVARNTTGGLICMKCVNASHLEECNSTVQCQADEHCYTESIIHVHSLVVKYNAGCSPKTICGFTFSGKRQTHLIPCSKCCEGGDLCNAKLCGITSNQTVVLSSHVPVTNGPVQTSPFTTTIRTSPATTTLPTSSNVSTTNGLKCMQCVNASHLEECNATVQCQASEHCYTESIIHSLVVKYNAGCSPKTICGFTFSGKRQTHLIPCSKCCEGGDLCNAKLCGITSNQTVVLSSHVPVTNAPVQTSPFTTTIRTSPATTTVSTVISSTKSIASSSPDKVTSLSTSVVSSGLLKCRKCVDATFIQYCTSVEECSPDEHCYLEATFVNFQVRYNGGCSSRTVCGLSGRRQTDLVACFKCCSGSDYCNAELCGIPSNPSIVPTAAPPTSATTAVTSHTTDVTSHSAAVTSSGTTVHGTSTPDGGTRCYFCDELHHGLVSQHGHCAYLTTCQTDEMCSVEDFISEGGAITHAFGCQNKNICRLLTKLAIEDRYRCEDPQIQSGGFCDRKRETDHSTCNVCCGEGSCNGESCTRVLDGLYELWKLHILDMYTLTQNGSFPTLPGTTRA